MRVTLLRSAAPFYFFFLCFVFFFALPPSQTRLPASCFHEEAARRARNKVSVTSARHAHTLTGLSAPDVEKKAKTSAYVRLTESRPRRRRKRTAPQRAAVPVERRERAPSVGARSPGKGSEGPRQARHPPFQATTEGERCSALCPTRHPPGPFRFSRGSFRWLHSHFRVGE